MRRTRTLLVGNDRSLTLRTGLPAPDTIVSYQIAEYDLWCAAICT